MQQMRIGVIGGSTTIPTNEAVCKETVRAFELQLQKSGAEIVNLHSSDELSALLASECAGVVVFPYATTETSILVQQAFREANGKAPIIFPQILGAFHNLTEPLETAYLTDHTAFTNAGHDLKAYDANTRTWRAGTPLAQVLETPFRPVPTAKHALAKHEAA